MPLIGKAHAHSMTENSRAIVPCSAVNVEWIDATVRKRELNWYVKVEERKP